MMLDGTLETIAMQGQEAITEYITNSDFSLSLGLISCISIIVCASWFFLLRGKRFVTTDITKKNESPTAFMIIALIVLMFGVQFFMVLFNLALQPILEMLNVSMTETMESATTNLFMDPFGILYIVLVGPVMEELVFRGAVMRKLERYGANFAIVTSAILFGLYHIILYQAIFAFLIGLIFAYTAGRYSLKWAIVLHILNNLLAWVSTLAETAVYVVVGCYFVGFVASIVLVILKRNLFKAQKRAGAPVFPRVFATAYSSVFFILYVVVFVLMGFLIL